MVSPFLLLAVNCSPGVRVTDTIVFLIFLTGVQRSVQVSADNAGIADYVQGKNKWK